MNDTMSVNEVPIQGSNQWAFESTELGTYQILISKPIQPAPETGYPVIYVLDGNALFSTVHDAIKLQSARAEKTGVPPAVIVGIGYPGDRPFSKRRFRDFTPPTTNPHTMIGPRGQEWPEGGGADHFLQFIEAELKPEIENRYPIDRAKQTLLGHSLGGLYTLYTAFTKSESFQSYIAISPSIWWRDRCLLMNEEEFLAQLGQKQSLSVYMAVGSMEKDYMVRDAATMAKRLKSKQSGTFRISYMEAEGENHMSVVPTVLSRALRFVNEG